MIVMVMTLVRSSLKYGNRGTQDNVALRTKDLHPYALFAVQKVFSYSNKTLVFRWYRTACPERSVRGADPARFRILGPIPSMLHATEIFAIHRTGIQPCLSWNFGLRCACDRVDRNCLDEPLGGAAPHEPLL